jgi:hypothetical protein
MEAVLKRFIIGLTFLQLLIFGGISCPASTLKTVDIGDSQTGIRITEQNDLELILEVKIGSVDFVQVNSRGGEFVLPIVKGFSRSNKIGEPSLPMLGKLISIPYGAELEFDIINTDYEEIDLKKQNILSPIIPVQPSLSKSVDPASVPFEHNKLLYQKDEFYKQPLVRSEVVGTMRSVHLGKVTISPFEYNPVSGALKVCRDITLRVRYLNPQKQQSDDMVDKYYSPFYEVIYNEIINYQSPPSGEKGDLTTYPIRYMIISDRMFEAQLQPFIEWKAKKGFIVDTAFTDVIGYSNAEIRGYIQSEYNAASPPENPAPSFVLLVGDHSQIPAFMGTDQHYTDLDFCEFTGDVFPEIYYGRFSAESTADLQPQIDKTLEYERYEMPDPSYLERVTLVAGVDANFAITHGNGQINYGTANYFNIAHGIYPDIWLYPASNDPSADGEIIQTISDGISLYNYSAHCNQSGHADPSFKTYDLPGLTNYNQYLLGIGNCCLPNDFVGYSPCFGEAFLRLEGKGGIGYIGATDNTMWNEDYWWAVGNGPIIGSGATYEQTGPGAFDGIFHDHGEPMTEHYVTNSAIVFAGNMAVTEAGSMYELYYWEAYMLMGDPSLSTYIGVPTINNIVHPSALTIDALSIDISADPGSYIGISMDGVVHGAGYVDETGQITIPLVEFPYPGNADIVVSAQFRQPYISQIEIASPEGPYVVLGEETVNDASGNNNGIVDASETVQMSIELRNIGVDDALNSMATLTISDPYISITDGSEYCGTITAGSGTISFVDAFEIVVDVSTPDNHLAEFELNVTADNGSWSNDITLQIRSLPDIYILADEISESITEGSKADCPLVIENHGTGPLDYYISKQTATEKIELNGIPAKGRGGADQFGYAWIDSDEPDGPDYEWVDISTIGTDVTGLGDNDATGAIPIGFDFEFYGDSYSELYISSNGLVTFGAPGSEAANTDLPDATAPNNLLAVFWDDLDPSIGGNIYYHYDEIDERFIASYEGVPFKHLSFGSGSLNFQVLLYSNGDIVFQYGVMNPGLYKMLNGATIGIESTFGTYGLATVYNDDYVHNNMAVKFSSSSWLNVDPGNGTIDSYGFVEVNVSLEPADMDIGTYFGMLTVVSNDPDTPGWNIPVTMTVREICVCGDIDNNGIVDILDITYLIDFKFKDGPTPLYDICSDVNSDDSVDILDIVHMIDFKFKDDVAPLCLL